MTGDSADGVIVVLAIHVGLGKIAHMAFRIEKQRTPKPAVASGPPRLRPIARQTQWSLTEYVCSAGPHDRPLEERHERVSMALVTSGTFRYRTDTGEGILYPGAFLLGNAGACYECGHEHSHGDRCLALHVDRELFAEVASGASGSNRSQFRSAVLPALSKFAAMSVSLLQPSSSILTLEETVFTLIETVVRAAVTNHTPPRRPRPVATRRMPQVLEYIDASLERNLNLMELSNLAAMSKYHFLRTFKHATGLTPHQYILGCRLRRAAMALRTTQTPVARIAADQGFGDLSTFNHTFRRVMGLTPTTFRANKH
jgi:AraC family transcriptional regulator